MTGIARHSGYPFYPSETWFVVLACLIFPTPALSAGEYTGTGRDFVVAPDGNDAYPGTLTRPWKSLGKAAQTVRPGDVVFVRKGRYPAGTVIRRSGTENAPIVFRNFPRERPVIHGLAKHTAGLVLDGVRFVIIRGFELRGVGAIQSEVRHRTVWGGIVLKDAQDCVVEDNVIVPGDAENAPEGWIGAPGIRLWSITPTAGTRRNVIRGNDCSQGWSGAHVLGPASANLFEGNFFHGNQETGGDSDGAGQDNAARKNVSIGDKRPYNPRDSRYRYNIFANNADDGLDMWTSVNNLVEYNLAYGNGTGRKKGNGNAYKMGPGGFNTVRYCLARGNRAQAFDDNRGEHNIWEHNVAYANGKLGEGKSGAIHITTVEQWRENNLRRRIQAKIEAFRAALTEPVPPNAPRGARRGGGRLTWSAPYPAEDGDTAAYFVIRLDGKAIGITRSLSFDLPARVRGSLAVCAVDDSYLDNHSDCISTDR